MFSALEKDWKIKFPFLLLLFLTMCFLVKANVGFSIELHEKVLVVYC